MRSLPFLFLAACLTEPQVADYDASCVVDEDCAVVIDLGFCGACAQLDVLSVDDAEVFTSDQDRYADQKRCQASILIACFPPEPTSVDPWCDDGTCALRQVEA